MCAKVLVVEDNKENLYLLSYLLTALDFTVIYATDGLEAVEKAFETEPDLIFMDIDLPKLNGVDATKRIKSKDGFDDTPIIALTGLAMAGDRERFLAAGCEDYISKPYVVKDIVEALDKYAQE